MTIFFSFYKPYPQVRLDWIAAQPVSFSIPLVAGLTNAFDEGRRLQTARDGQELDPASASALLQSMAVIKTILIVGCTFDIIGSQR